ncbi:preprotein translocase subunit SecE [Clostridium aminobutyricum]|uniref:Protein translocase subunit SecE n=1 Tax=Clostridium aminobutyricum TaxID=33953 RepID=A0A939DBA5_CLOAM|nr:preprotein translocase subunit SecE [Clostridium aminobutyricum]MBN7774585.1 preprotein translocase subunit SecE [Clostridium aminobutyricum]
MDNEKAKKKPVAAPKKERMSIKDYFKGIRLEIKKVVWPTKKELGSYTAIVLITCAFFAVGFWLIDMGVLTALKAILGISL